MSEQMAVNFAVFRQSLVAYLGTDEYRKFVSQARQASRLRFWQDGVLERFFDAHPHLRLGRDDLLVALRVCEVHGAQLRHDRIEVVEGNADFTDDYHRAKRDVFPNAASGPFYTEGRPTPGRIVDVWFCPACRDAQAAWAATNSGRHPGRVTASQKRRTTYWEYALKWMADDRGEFPERFRAKFAEREAEVNAKLRPGDQLWEFEFGDWNAFAGVSGLAVVRNGVVVEHWVEWKS
jgi:hypothetical protein